MVQQEGGQREAALLAEDRLVVVPQVVDYLEARKKARAQRVAHWWAVDLPVEVRRVAGPTAADLMAEPLPRPRQSKQQAWRLASGCLASGRLVPLLPEVELPMGVSLTDGSGRARHDRKKEENEHKEQDFNRTEAR